MARRSTLKCTGQRFGACEKLLLSEVSTEKEGPVWIQVATGNTYKGHPQAKSRALVWNKPFFERVVANFKSHPSYTGSSRVVPFDYEHASELSPTSGSIPMSGAPAPAWALDLDIRGTDDAPELWALSEMGETILNQVRAEPPEYQWTSVAIWANAVDPVSGDELGPVLTSIAFTNKPFIKGMAPIKARVEVWGDAESPEEFIVGLRQILETSEKATSQELVGILDKVYAAWTAPHQLQLPGFPDGVGFVLSQVRRLMGLDVTATAEEIVASAGQMLGAASQTPKQPVIPPENSAMPEPTTNATATKLASIYGVKDKEDAILCAAEEAAKKASVFDQLQALFGSTDMQSLVQDATKAISDAEKSKPIVEALANAAGSLSANDQQEVDDEVEKVAATNRGLDRDDIRSRVLATLVCNRFAEAIKMADQAQEAEAKAEVEQIVASLSHDREAQERLFPIMLSQRLDAGRDPKKLEEFRRQFPVQDTSTNYLKQPIVASRGGTQLGGQLTGLGGQGNQPTMMSQQPLGGQQQTEQQHPLLGYPGNSTNEKARNYLCAKKEGFKFLAARDQSFEAGRYLREGAPVLT